MRPVAQNSQANAQPTWELTQTTYFGIFRAVQERNADGLEGLRPLAAEQVLGEPVLRRNDLVDERQMRDGRLLPDPIEDAARTRPARDPDTRPCEPR